MSHSDNCEARADEEPHAAAVLQIRPVRPGEGPVLIGLWVASWQETMPGIDFAARRPWIARFLDDPGLVVLVAERNGTEGFAAVKGRVLDQLVVRSGRKGCGVGRALVSACKAMCPSGLDLEVNEDNARAVIFYRRQDFRTVGTGTNPNSGLATLRLSWRPGARPPKT